MKKILKAVIKYISIALFGVVLFATTSQFANAQRTTASIGGEAFFLILPLIWWLAEETLNDYICTTKSKSEQVSEKNAQDSPAESEQKK